MPFHTKAADRTLKSGTLYFFKIFISTAFLAVLFIFMPAKAWADDDTAPATAGQSEEKKRSFQTGTNFFDKADISGSLGYFQRKRWRYNVNTKFFDTNLNHATTQASMDFTSGFIADHVGVDFAAFGSVDLYNTGGVDHEMNFVPWKDPWHPDWTKTHTKDGASIYKAALKFKGGPFWGKIGYFQPTGPGVLGVNWSIYPGTYQGIEAGADVGKLSVAAAIANGYKAPWYKNIYNMRRDDNSKVDCIWSLGARYSFDLGLTLELAYGQSEDYLQNAQFKASYSKKFTSGTFSTGYQLYLMADVNDNSGINKNFDGLAQQHYVFGKYETDLWTLKGEFTYTLAPYDNADQPGYFAYRLIGRYGGGKGAYDIWWDNRSDWNAHNEKAFFLGISRKLDDFMPIKGFETGVSGAYGFDGEAYGIAEHLKERSASADVGYTVPDGFFKGTMAKLHFTYYDNMTNLPSWVGFKNVFQDEKDIKFIFMIPFSI